MKKTHACQLIIIVQEIIIEHVELRLATIWWTFKYYTCTYKVKIESNGWQILDTIAISNVFNITSSKAIISIHHSICQNVK